MIFAENHSEGNLLVAKVSENNLGEFAGFREVHLGETLNVPSEILFPPPPPPPFLQGAP